jgi:hypothetical protein
MPAKYGASVMMPIEDYYLLFAKLSAPRCLKNSAFVVAPAAASRLELLYRRTTFVSTGAQAWDESMGLLTVHAAHVVVGRAGACWRRGALQPPK